MMQGQAYPLDACCMGLSTLHLWSQALLVNFMGFAWYMQANRFVSAPWSIALCVARTIQPIQTTARWRALTQHLPAKASVSCLLHQVSFVAFNMSKMDFELQGQRFLTKLLIWTFSKAVLLSFCHHCNTLCSAARGKQSGQSA